MGNESVDSDSEKNIIEIRLLLDKYYRYANQFYSITKEYDPSIFDKYKINPVPHIGKKKEWSDVITPFTKEELKDIITDMWLIIRPMDILKKVEKIKKVPILREIEAFNRNEAGNQGISTIPNHWGLVFKTKNHKYVSIQYPPVTVQKAENKEHAIFQILLGSKENNYYYEEENMKRIFEDLKIRRKISLSQLIEYSHYCHKTRYNALDNNCQKFACMIITYLTEIDAEYIRLKTNIFVKAFTLEEKKILSSKNVGEILDYVDEEIKSINNKNNNFIYENKRYVEFIVFAIIFSELKNYKTYQEIFSIIKKIITQLIVDCCCENSKEFDNLNIKF